MSGPATAIFIADPIAVMLSGSAIRASQAIAAGYATAAQMREKQAGHRSQLQNELAAAASKGSEALLREVAAAEAEFSTMASLGQRYANQDKFTALRSARPDDGDGLQLAAYIHSLRALVNELRAILLTESARRMDDLGETLTLDDAVARAEAACGKTAVERLLARIAHLGEIPQDIAAVAKEIADAPFADSERVQLLTNELRLRVQKHVETAQARAVEEASALVLRESLKDLGYQVEDVSNTLFVEGGMIHFRRQGWGDYMVRMRVDAKTRAANFNVIRAVEESSNERSVQDHLAEDRWCAEFPALLRALDDRGLKLTVTRRLEAGELPVQLVQKDKLPGFVEEQTTERAAKLQARNIK